MEFWGTEINSRLLRFTLKVWGRFWAVSKCFRVVRQIFQVSFFHTFYLRQPRDQHKNTTILPFLELEFNVLAFNLPQMPPAAGPFLVFSTMQNRENGKGTAEPLYVSFNSQFARHTRPRLVFWILRIYTWILGVICEAYSATPYIWHLCIFLQKILHK